MSDEERSQAPSHRRRREAREAGHVAHSPDLTAAAGLVAASILLGIWGDDLLRGLIDLVRLPLTAASLAFTSGPITTTAVAGFVRQTAWAVLMPLVGLIAGTAVVMLTAHQLQVGFLWVPGLLAPRPERLLGGMSVATDPAAALSRAAWTTAKAAALLAAVAWSIGSNLDACQGLASLESSALAAACGGLARSMLRNVALALAALGVVDYVLRWRKHEAQLRLTPEEGRREQRETDGDPALRSRRRNIARSWRNDPSELLPGAAMLLTGPPGLAVLLAGGPPPERPITVRRVARGREAFALRGAARDADLPVRDAPRLAAFLARGPSAAGSLPEDLSTLLAELWPAEHDLR